MESFRRVQSVRQYTQRHNVTFLSVQRRTTVRGYVMEAAAAALLLISGAAWLLAPRSEVMFTGRRRIMLLSREEEAALVSYMGDELEEMQEKALPPSHALHKLTARVAGKIVAAAEANDVHYDWSVSVIQTAQRNAFCMPGGVIVVTTSMLEWLQRQSEAGSIPDAETGLAAILAHEVGHAVAQHSAEGLSRAPAKIVLALLSESSPLLPPLLEVSLDLPYSRMVEREADTIGFVLYSYTEYDLEAYPQLYALIDSPSGNSAQDDDTEGSEGDADGAAAGEEGGEGGDGDDDEEDDDEDDTPIEWLSTHPSGPNRAQATAALLPLMREARKSLRQPLSGLQRTARGLWGDLERDGAEAKLVPWQHVPELHQALQEHAAAQWDASWWSRLPCWLVASDPAPDDETRNISPAGAAGRIAHEPVIAPKAEEVAEERQRGPLSVFDDDMRSSEEDQRGDAEGR